MYRFSVEHGVYVQGLEHWNHFTLPVWLSLDVKDKLGYHTRFDVYQLLFWFWCVVVLAYSLPGITACCIKYMYPSEYFGFYKIVPFRKRHLFGLDRVHAGLKKRLGFVFGKNFWLKFRKEVTENDSPWKGLCSLVCVFSSLPIVAIFPPLFSWHKIKNRNVFLFVPVIVASVVTFFVLLLSLRIYFNFILFTIAAGMYHYEKTLTYAGRVPHFHFQNTARCQKATS